MALVLAFRIGKHDFLRVDIVDFLYLNMDKKMSKSQIKRLIKDNAIEYWFESYKEKKQ